MNPPAFLGGVNLVATENWMQEIEKTLTVLQRIDEQWVLYASYKLTDEAKRWWVATKLLEEQRPMPMDMTWSKFREIFFDRYFPATVKEAKVQEFLSLFQGSMTVQQYVVKFIEFSCFCPYIIPNEAKKARMFNRKLRRDIYRHVAVLKMQDFSELVDRVMVVEESA
ncbi:uncharacterized protein LOC131145766 [Malania oleifera]|uniref:uncharacterized protein LOC131145766 n=1 Tax=Malania oleifera TaxID=397392 RepID=UPI0025AE4543|nr:uncharacterized protein LOC131145766 [Malania oleifera]